MRKNYWAITHDLSGTRLYSVWRDMKQRCLNPNNRIYKHYGARGIKVCDAWSSDFKVFYDWATDSGYQEGLSIDRIDNDGNYEPSNCRWVTKSIQNMNRRSLKNTSGYIGISRHSEANRWYGRLKVNGKQIYTGMSEDILEAVKMRNEYIVEHSLPNQLNEVE